MELPKAQISDFILSGGEKTAITPLVIDASNYNCQSNDVNLNKAKSEVMLPPKSWFKWGQLLRLSIAALLMSWALSGCATSDVTIVEWKDASSIVSSDVLFKVISENTTASSTQVKPLAFVVPLSSVAKLVIFNFNSHELCGQKLCTYVAYDVSGDQARQARQVWQKYLNPNLPPGEHLFSVTKDDATAQPCLIVNQVENDQLRYSSFCYNGIQLQASENRLMKTSHK